MRGSHETQADGATRPRAHGLGRGDLVGRYVVLGELGRGGMGVVYAAYDPELDRKVALKLLRSDEGGSRSTDGLRRLLREAQAMAKLGHPNVIAVHDVGQHDTSVYVAMEFVDGETMGSWLKKDLPWRAVLDVFIAAGRGLSAAHAKGLVHRDFKPDNVMVDRERRVRVMDFGLARATGVPSRSEASQQGLPEGTGDGDATPSTHALGSELTRKGSVVGTPAYMAPEQHLELDVSAAADQFSFCVALWEGLFGERPFGGESLAALAFNVTQGTVREPPGRTDVPSWLHRACRRGLSVKPEQRFASMAELLSELARGQARSRRRRLLVALGALALVGAGAEGFRRYGVARTVAACEAEGASIDLVWNEPVRERVRAGLLDTRLSFAETTAENVMPWLDAQASAWAEHRKAACVRAEVEESLDAATLDKAHWCLEERRLGLQALVFELERADESVVQNAVPAAAGLAPVSPCLDDAVLAALPEPPPVGVRAAAAEVRTELARAGALLSAGRYEEGLAVVRPTLEQAELVAWPPLIAAVRHREGRLLDRAAAYPEAEATSVAAYMDAAKARAWEVAAAAAIGLVFTVGYRAARHDEGRTWAGHAEVAVSFARDPLGLSEALRLSNLAILHRVTGEYAQAKELLVRALAIQEQALGPAHPDVAQSLNNLGNVYGRTGEHAAAKELHARGLAIREETLGPNHPVVAESLNNLAGIHDSLGDYSGSRELHARALAIRERALGPTHPDVAQGLNNLAVLEHTLGRPAIAKRLFTRALTIFEQTLGPAHPDVAQTLNNLGSIALETLAYPEARALYAQAVAIREQVLGPAHPDLAQSLNNLAIVHLETGAYAEAKEVNARALAIREEALGPDHVDVAYSLSNLANVHQAMGAYAQARALQTRALAIFERALGLAHPNVAQCLNSLATLHHATGRLAQANDLYLRTLATFERALGPTHPSVAETLANLGTLNIDQNRPAAALGMLERAVGIYDARAGIQFGELQARFALAEALWSTGTDRARARAEAQRARDGYREAGDPAKAALAEVERWLARHR